MGLIDWPDVLNEGKGTAREWLEVICVDWLIGIKLCFERERRGRDPLKILTLHVEVHVEV